MSKPKTQAQKARDNRANQLNPNHVDYWKSRVGSKPKPKVVTKIVKKVEVQKPKKNEFIGIYCPACKQKKAYIYIYGSDHCRCKNCGYQFRLNI